MRTQVRKWGNSISLRIPKSFAEEVGLEDESPVDISLEDGKIIVQPVAPSEFTLEELMAQVTEENRHHEIDTGPACGEEAW